MEIGQHFAYQPNEKHEDVILTSKLSFCCDSDVVAVTVEVLVIACTVRLSFFCSQSRGLGVGVRRGEKIFYGLFLYSSYSR